MLLKSYFEINLTQIAIFGLRLKISHGTIKR
jgi:hypothetical protein